MSTHNVSRDRNPAARLKPTGLKRLVAGMALALVATAGSGCKHYLEHGRSDHYIPIHHEEMHPIEVTKKAGNLRVRVDAGSYGLSAGQEGRVRRFVSKFARENQGQLVIAAPTGSENEAAAYNAMTQIRSILASAGVPPAAVRFRPYDAEGRRSPSIKMRYARYVATPSQCGDWSENLASDRGNLSYPNFGCATQNNLAVMIANPRDLEKPRGTAPRSSERRDVVWDKYIRGESTIADKAEEEKTKVSEVGN